MEGSAATVKGTGLGGGMAVLRVSVSQIMGGGRPLKLVPPTSDLISGTPGVEKVFDFNFQLNCFLILRLKQRAVLRFCKKRYKFTLALYLHNIYTNNNYINKYPSFLLSAAAGFHYHIFIHSHVIALSLSHQESESSCHIRDTHGASSLRRTAVVQHVLYVGVVRHGSV